MLLLTHAHTWLTHGQVERADIRTAMIFALDCADAGAEIVETLGDALTIPETPIPLKIAR
jgi:U2-associated protein SR140